MTDPATWVFVGEAIFGTGAGAATAVKVTSIVVSIVVNTAIASLLGKILAPSFDKSSRGGKGVQANVKSNIEPRKTIYGEAVVGGPFVIMESSGIAIWDNVEIHNKELRFIIALAGHPVEDILGVFVGEEYIDISGDLGTNDLSSTGTGEPHDRTYTVASGPYARESASIFGNPGWIPKLEFIKVNGWAYADKTYVNDETTHDQVSADQARAQEIANRLEAPWSVSGLTRDSGTGIWEAGGANRHKLTNCAYIYVAVHFFKDKLTSLPQFRFHVKGKRLYNPYKDTTNMSSYGATSSTHNLNDVDTYEWSDDWALCCLDYLRSTDYGLAAVDDPTISTCEIDWTEAINAHITSSEVITNGYLNSPYTGTGPRYTINGAFTVDTTPISTMEALLSSGAGELIYAQGKYKLRPGIYRPPNSPSDIINEDMIVSPLSITTHAPRSQLFNKSAGIFLDKGYTGVPSTNNPPTFEPTDFPIVSPIDSSGVNPYEVEDGEEIIRDFDYPFTTSSHEAQRLARIQLERVRRGFTVSFEATLELLKYSVGDTVYLEILSDSKYTGEAFYNKLGLDNAVQPRPDSPQTAYYKQFKILEMSYTENFTIAVTMIEEAEGVYDWNDGYANPPTDSLQAELVVDDWKAEIIPPSWIVSSPYSTVTETTTGSDISTEIRWSQPDRGSTVTALDGADVSSYEVQYGIVTDDVNSVPADRVADWLNAGIFFNEHHSAVQGPAVLTNIFINPTTKYDFRVRAILYSGRRSDWAYYSVDIGFDHTPQIPYGASRYYIYAIYGTTIKNHLGLITLQAREITSAGDNALTEGTIRLYEGTSPYNEITVANGYTSPSDGFTATFDTDDINDSKVVVLSDGQPPGGTQLDAVTLVDVTDGIDGISTYLTVSSPYVTTDSTGTTYSFINPSSAYRIFDGSTEITDTSAVTYSIVGTATKNGLTISISDTIGTKGEISFSGASWTTNSEDFTVRATYNSVNYDLPIRMSKVNKGGRGVSVQLTKEAEVITADNDGTNYTLPTNPVTRFSITDESGDVTSLATFSVLSPDTVDGLTATISNNSPTQGEISLSGASWTGTEATFTFQADYDGQSYTKIYTISKAIKGDTGTDGLNQATVYLYQRTATESPIPGDPANSLTYTFSTATLSGTPGNGWSIELPGAGSPVLWRISAVASSLTDTDTINTTDWSTAEILAIDGADGKVGWGHDLTFSSTDIDTVAWSSGSVWTAGGTTYSINAGNTGNMTARTYIYLDSDVSLTVLQTTTNAQTTVGDNRILIAVAEDINSPNTGTEAFYQVFGGKGGLKIAADEIAANSIIANNINASFYTGREFSGGTFQTRNPSTTSPYETSARAVLQEDAPQLGLYTTYDGTEPDTQIFGVTETASGAELYLLGDFVAGSIDTGQMFSAAGISDLRGRLGVDEPAGADTGGLASIVTPTYLPTASTDTDLDQNVYTTGLQENSLTFTIYDYGVDIDPYTAPSWRVRLYWSDDNISHTLIPGADWTVTGTVTGKYDLHTLELNATRSINWTPASPFASGDTIYFMVRTQRLSGDSVNPRLTACTASEQITSAGGTTIADGTVDDSLLRWNNTGGTWDEKTGVRITDDNRLRVYDDSGETDYIELYHDDIDAWININAASTLKIDGPHTEVHFLDGPQLKVYDATDSNWIGLNTTDGTLSYLTSSSSWIELGAGSGVRVANGDEFYVRGGSVRFYDTGVVDYVDFTHDGVDLNITHSGTTDWNITGINGFNVVNYNFDVDQTVGAGQDNYVLTYNNSNGLISLEAAAAGGANQLSDLTDVGTVGYTNRHVLIADGVNYDSRALVEADISNLGSYLTDVVQDTTPQLGGNLNLNSKKIDGTGTIDYTGQLKLTTTGSHITCYDSDGADTLDRGLFELNSSNINIYAYDNSTATWRLPFRCAVGDGNVSIAGTACATVNITPTSNINLTPGSNVQVLSGAGLRVYEAANADYGELTHDGTYFDISTGSSDPIRLQAVNGENSIYCTPNGDVKLYNDNVEQFNTQQHNATGQTTAAQVRHHDTSFHDVGLNVLPTFNFNATDTLEARHCGTITGKTNTTSYTLNGPTSSDLDFPVGGVCTVANFGSSTNYSFTDQASCTIYYLDGQSAPQDISGTATLAPGGIITMYRYSSSAIYVWGTGFTV